MRTVRPFYLILALVIGWAPLAGCASVFGVDKVPHEVWRKLTSGEAQDLIVVFDDSAVVAEASRLKESKGIIFDDKDTLQFKATRYATIKRDAIDTLPPDQVEILKDYDALPLIFLRFRSAAALKALLDHPSVLRAYEDKQEHLMPRSVRP